MGPATKRMLYRYNDPYKLAVDNLVNRHLSLFEWLGMVTIHENTEDALERGVFNAEYFCAQFACQVVVCWAGLQKQRRSDLELSERLASLGIMGEN